MNSLSQKMLATTLVIGGLTVASLATAQTTEAWGRTVARGYARLSPTAQQDVKQYSQYVVGLDEQEMIYYKQARKEATQAYVEYFSAVLGMTPTQVKQAMKDGNRFGEILQDAGISEAEMRAHMQAAAVASLNAKVNAGFITAETAAEIYTNLNLTFNDLLAVWY